MSLTSVAVLAFDGVSPFDLGVLCEVFGVDRSAVGVPRVNFRVVGVGNGRLSAGFGMELSVSADVSFIAQADLVAVPGSLGNNDSDPAILEALRRAHARGAWILSICTGAFTLASAGLLDGRSATTHWMHTEELARNFPAVQVKPDVLYVEDNRIVSSAGTAAGIEASLHIVRRHFGAEAANTIARGMVVWPQRDGSQAQYLDAPVPAVGSDSLSGVLSWMLEHLSEPMTVAQLARRALMSPRTFARRFRAETSTTPGAWLNQQRVLHAQRLLESTDQTIDQIAREAGFGAAPVLRHHFQRSLAVTPMAYRSRFAANRVSSRMQSRQGA